MVESGHLINLWRRDLFDARFQLLSDANETAMPEIDNSTAGRASSDNALQFLETPSDLIPGVYEGGLKTWECSLDLVSYLHSLREVDHGFGRGKRILEVSSEKNTAD
jgi:protein-histidine N-methyltransferase